ncbi:hypothetical protein GBF35_33075 [Nonomuraea phyllanthi]|uniref:hypothetical protein n=1 Tax=Nonomuraea phyllanthi TaxID=2219224 RepID=UPI0012937EC2|nr:hypothetical protein [Nonomuraea phyllanthi]QFY10800.1 hypothetical protein GBF35_33075 [Nonomuraea phyllanthi]
MPSVVVAFQYSPFSSPFWAPVTFSKRVPSSPRMRHVPSAAWISSPPLPFQVTVALSYAQHRSPGSTPLLLGAPSSAHPL